MRRMICRNFRIVELALVEEYVVSVYADRRSRWSCRFAVGTQSIQEV
jgi:hypothetical protein